MPLLASEPPPSAKPRVNVLVTDVDNTLLDWVAMWYAAFHAMLIRLAETSGIPQAVLEREFRAIHQRHGTSEYAFSIQELPSLIAKHPQEDLTVIYRDAIQDYRKARKETLELYPGVLDSLRRLRSAGTRIVAYTETMGFYSLRRIKMLGLDGILDYVYSPADHELPEGLSPEQIRFYPKEEYELKSTIHRHTPKGVLKPNPEVLLDILAAVSADPSSTVYVGDSLMKDILMAQQAGITDVFAKYGTAQHLEEYELLRRVSHWPDEAVEREKKLTVGRHVNPTYTLSQSFAELLDLFVFEPFKPLAR